jgi:hypothetical protein
MLATRSEQKYLDAIETLIKQTIPEGAVGGSKPKKGNASYQGGLKDKPLKSHAESDKQASNGSKKPASKKGQKPRFDDGKPEVKGFGDEMPGFFGKVD